MILSYLLGQFRNARAGGLERRKEDLLRQTPAPTFWLFGKTGTGKSSIIKYLTGADAVEIGKGYRTTTRHSQQFDFPSRECPVLRFLDTRGLGEPGYDPAEDIKTFRETAHALIVTVPLTDFAQELVIGPLRQIRASRPERPILLAITCLHRAIPQRQHPPYPFNDSLEPAGLIEEWARPLAEQRRQFAGLIDAVVPIDLTQPSDGFANPHYGGEHLRKTLAELLPGAQREAFLTLGSGLQELTDIYQRRAFPYVLGAASLAGVAAAVPVPYLEIPVVVAIQAMMARQIATVYEIPPDRRSLLETGSAVGLGMLTRLAAAELLKLIPFVGSIASTAASTAATLALGRTCCWYYAEIRKGHVPTKEQFASVFREKMKPAG
jgi:uncharacterized protein (DUF697 family)/predicted GTPase